MHFVNSKGLLSAGNGMNLYRGCTHGCIYCDSRSTCYQMDHDFEDIEVKQNAPELLENALRRKRKKCMVGTGAMCDPYMPCEEQLKLTRQCLEIIDRYGFGATVQTKSDRVLRDLDLLDSINRQSKAVVQMTLTTYDEALCRLLEPKVCTTRRRYEVLKILQKNGLKQRYKQVYGNSYECMSRNNDTLMRLFHSQCERHGIWHNVEQIFSYLHEFPEDENQMCLFDLIR